MYVILTSYTFIPDYVSSCDCQSKRFNINAMYNHPSRFDYELLKWLPFSVKTVLMD